MIDVTLPNGNVIKNVPENVSKDQVMNLAIRNGLATPADFGLATPADLIGAGIPPEAPSSAKTGGHAVAPTSEDDFSSFMAGTIFSMVEAGGKIKNMFGLVSEEDAAKEQQQLNVLRERLGIHRQINPVSTGVGEVAGEIAPAAAGWGAGAALGRAGGFVGRSVAGSMGSQLALGDMPTAETTALDVLLDSTLHGTGRLLGAAYRGIRGAPESSGAELVSLAQQHNVPLMASDVYGPKTMPGKVVRTAGEQIPFIGTGGARAVQQEARQRSVRELGEKYAGASPEELVASVQRKQRGVRAAIGTRYNEITAQMSDTPVDASKTQAAIDAVIADLERPGVIRDETSIATLKKIREDMAAAPQTFTSLKENRTAFRDLVKGDTRPALPSGTDEKMGRIQNAMTDDLRGAVRTKLGDGALKKYISSDTEWAKNAQEVSKSRLKSVIESGDITPENIMRMVFSQNASEISRLHRALDDKGRDFMRRAVVSDALAKSMDGDKINPDRFVKELRKREKQIGIAFEGDERKELVGIIRLLEATKHAQEAVANPATGARMMPVAWTALIGGTGFSTGLIPAVAMAVGSAGAAHVAESKTMRNALIKLAGTPQGSTKFEQVVEEVRNAVRAALVSQLSGEDINL
ncbi:MAG: hypothetical protein LBU96_14595 [Yokenella regensburgei]|jgi:hypothetical protein|nr:hypothetical protein [Yokenella regensburgei]